MRQARRAYIQAVDPYNRALDAVNQDYTDRVPMAQFHSSSLAEIAALHSVRSKLDSVRWPAPITPYIHAQLTTDLRADLRCARDQLSASSYSQADTISYNQDCTEAQNTSNADTIRSLLHLPSLSS
jgi:hypothetical protein